MSPESRGGESDLHEDDWSFEPPVPGARRTTIEEAVAFFDDETDASPPALPTRAARGRALVAGIALGAFALGLISGAFGVILFREPETPPEISGEVIAPSPAMPSPPTATPPTVLTADLADPLTLRGDKATLSVVAQELVDPFEDPNYEPATGNRLVSMRLRVGNLGTETFEGDIAGQLLLRADNGKEFRVTPAELSAETRIADDVQLHPEGVVEGIAVFELPSALTPEALDFAVPNDSGPAIGRWTLT